MSHNTQSLAQLQPPASDGYRGRIAPTPTGLLHLGHARTFHIAWQRARAAGGTLVYRQEDLDPLRCTAAFAQAAIDDLHRYGLDWDEGPGCIRHVSQTAPKPQQNAAEANASPQAPVSKTAADAAARTTASTASATLRTTTPTNVCTAASTAATDGPHAPYCQSQRTEFYRNALIQLIRSGHAYPSPHSRSDLGRALESGLALPTPPLFGEQDGEAIFPIQWRPNDAAWFANPSKRERVARAIETGIATAPRADLAEVNWRLRVPEGEVLRFTDAGFGEQAFTAGEDFGDFILWRRDDVPAYELAVVVDDIAMGITEVVRGADLLRSTARQLLLYRALKATAPAFCHCPLILDPQTGERLAKRSEALSLRALLERGEITAIEKTKG